MRKLRLNTPPPSVVADCLRFFTNHRAYTLQSDSRHSDSGNPAERHQDQAKEAERQKGSVFP
jgi:hypothetical protein